MTPPTAVEPPSRLGRARLGRLVGETPGSLTADGLTTGVPAPGKAAPGKAAAEADSG